MTAPVGAPPRPRRTRYVVAAAMCGGAIVAIVVLAVILSKNVVYYRSVSEALQQRAKHPDSNPTFRIAGVVVKGTIKETSDGVDFDLTDGDHTVRVVQHGDPPDLFKGGAPVLAEGKWKDAAFDSDRILIKHGSDYEPPKVTTTTTIGGGG